MKSTIDTRIFCQEVALISSLKGEVLVKRGSGEIRRATALEKLAVGDEVSTRDNASTIIFYYTGREVSISAGKTYIVSEERDESGIMRRLSSVFSNLLWGKGSNVSMVGATREAVSVDTNITLIYPSFNIRRDSILEFTWKDAQFSPKAQYVVVLTDEANTFKETSKVEGVLQLTMQMGTQVLSQRARLKWQVRNLLAEGSSAFKEFSFLSEKDSAMVDERLAKLKDILIGDSLSARFNLMRGLLFQEFSMIEDAEEEFSLFVQKRPNLSIGHHLLAKVLLQVGKTEESSKEQRKGERLLQEP